MIKDKLLVGIIRVLSTSFPDNSKLTGHHFNGNSYPINNKRGYAAKQKRNAKKVKRK